MEETSKQASKEPRWKWPRWKKVVTVIVGLIVILIIVAYTATSGVAKVSNEFLKDWQASNADAAYSLLSREAAAVTDKATLKEVVNKSGPILNAPAKMTGREVSGETGQAGTGKVTYEIKGTDGVTYNITINLIKESGVWKVVNFESAIKK